MFNCCCSFLTAAKKTEGNLETVDSVTVKTMWR